MKIEAGKFYRTRDGRKVLVSVNRPGERDVSYPFFHDNGEDLYHALTASGKSCVQDSDSDLVSEWLSESLTPHQKRTADMIKVMQAYVDGEEVEFSYDGENWQKIEEPSFSRGVKYRIAPAATPDTIDWSHVAPEFKWMARDSEGQCWLYLSQPKVGSGFWYSPDDATPADSFTSYRRGTCDWKGSLVKRP